MKVVKQHKRYSVTGKGSETYVSQKVENFLIAVLDSWRQRSDIQSMAGSSSRLISLVGRWVALASAPGSFERNDVRLFQDKSSSRSLSLVLTYSG